jgi:hypothetical protein
MVSVVDPPSCCHCLLKSFLRLLNFAQAPEPQRAIKSTQIPLADEGRQCGKTRGNIGTEATKNVLVGGLEHEF